MRALTHLGKGAIANRYSSRFWPAEISRWVANSCLPWDREPACTDFFRDLTVDEHAYLCAYIDAFLIALDNATEPEVTYDEP